MNGLFTKKVIILAILLFSLFLFGFAPKPFHHPGTGKTYRGSFLEGKDASLL